MKSTSYSLLFALLVCCGVNGIVSAATPAPCRTGVKAPAECAVNGMNPDAPHVVLDGQAAPAVPAAAPADPALDVYLEWHGRVAAGSAFSILMPWAALHHNAN